MATNAKKKAVDAPQDAAVVVKRTRKPVQSATEQKVSKSVAKRLAVQSNVRNILDGKKAQGKDAAPSAAAPAKKVAAKKSVVAKSRKPASPSETPVPNSSTQSAASSEPTSAKPENAEQAQAKADDFNAKVASGELPEGLHATTATIDPTDVCAKLVSAANRVPEGLLRFQPEERERLTPFLLFFERFWAVIPAYFKMNHSFVAKDFSTLQKQPEFASLVPVNSYARFEFTCGSRAIVLRSAVGCATFFFAENEFVDMLKKMPGALPEIIKEQAEKNKPSLTLMTGIPTGLMALVREFEKEPRLSLSSLVRIFGDPVNYLMQVPQLNLAKNVRDLAVVLSVAPTSV